ncbi:MAG: hypothetical protein WC048_18050 [Rhizobium sp.]|nr:hypothetical protein [Rhizobium sp.]
MEYAEIYEAVKCGFIDAMEEMKAKPRMMKIDRFEAEDDAGEPVTVVGIIDDDEEFIKFIVIEEWEDGELTPIVRRNIYKKGTAANTQT